jgi:hypothetical protein
MPKFVLYCALRIASKRDRIMFQGQKTQASMSLTPKLWHKSRSPIYKITRFCANASIPDRKYSRSCWEKRGVKLLVSVDISTCAPWIMLNEQHIMAGKNSSWANPQMEGHWKKMLRKEVTVWKGMVCRKVSSTVMMGTLTLSHPLAHCVHHSYYCLFWSYGAFGAPWFFQGY